MNNKQLYESIMKNVAKEIKNTLNEMDLSNLRSDIKTSNILPKMIIDPESDADINIDMMLDEIAGYIIQYKVKALLSRNNDIFDNIRFNGHNATYDFSFNFSENCIEHLPTTIIDNIDKQQLMGENKLEVKAFERDVTDIQLTSAQNRDLGRTDVWYLLVNYKNNGGTLEITHYYLLRSDEMKNCVTQRNQGRGAYGNKQVRLHEI